MSSRHIVFLQGTPSAFFSKTSHALLARGCQVTGISFCVGDALFWRGGNRLSYRGALAGWPAFFDEFITRAQVSDIVMMGDQRDYHKQAVEVAKARGVRVSIVDFGYLRPGWLTLESEGKNSNSHFPKTSEAIRALALDLPMPELASPYRDDFWCMARGDLLYSFSNLFLWFLYPRYRRSDRRPHPLLYFPASGFKLLFAGVNQKKAQSRLQALLAPKTRYFLFPLQLEHDYQLIAYSPFSNLSEVIEQVIRSFAAHAPADMHLLIKVHPWDPGLKRWEKRIDRWASEQGVSGRIVYLDGGDLDQMAKASQGMVTVNSTAGIQALRLGSPVMVLGEAIYHMSGLTYQGALDDFWQAATPPDAALVEQFLSALVATTQAKGAFFTEPGLTAAAQATAERLAQGRVGKINAV